MKTVVINKQFAVWQFRSATAARQYIKKQSDYHIKEIEGDKIRVYCYHSPCWECSNKKDCKYSI